MRLIAWFRRARPTALPSASDQVFLLRFCEAWWWALIWRCAALTAAAWQVTVGGLPNGWFGLPWLAIALVLGALATLETHPERLPVGVLATLGTLGAAMLLFASGYFVSAGALIVAAAPFSAYYIEFRSHPDPVVRNAVTVALTMPAVTLASLGYILLTPDESSLASPVLAMAGALAAGFLLLYALRRWWRQALTVARNLAFEEDVRRENDNRLFEAVVHDGLIALLEQAAAGQIADEVGRQRASELARWGRRRLLGERTPRSITDLIDEAVEQAALVNVHLATMNYSDGEPPAWVIAPFHEALGALVSNLRHAEVEQATLAVDASNQHLRVTLVDRGRGCDPMAPWGESTTQRVRRPLELIGGSAGWETAKGLGVTWRLNWEAATS